MRVVDSSNLSWEQISGHRVGSIEFKRLLAGTEGRKDNYELSLVKQEGEFHSPVHRHNFDQVRVPIHGRSSYAKNQYVHPGEIGYFPEGTFYGPQDIDEETLTLVLQCGGVSGDGFLSYRRLHEGYGLMQERGRFEGGKFTPNDQDALPKDSYEAIWEHMNGRPLRYPPQRFRAPIIMDIDSFAWREISAGVARKGLAEFAEGGVAMEVYRFEPATEFAFERKAALRLLYVLTGAIAFDRSNAPANSAVEIGIDETPRARASAPSEVLVLTLPTFAQ